MKNEIVNQLTLMGLFAFVLFDKKHASIHQKKCNKKNKIK